MCAAHAWVSWSHALVFWLNKRVCTPHAPTWIVSLPAGLGLTYSTCQVVDGTPKDSARGAPLSSATCRLYHQQKKACIAMQVIPYHLYSDRMFQRNQAGSGSDSHAQTQNPPRMLHHWHIENWYMDLNAKPVQTPQGWPLTGQYSRLSSSSVNTSIVRPLHISQSWTFPTTAFTLHFVKNHW